MIGNKCKYDESFTCFKFVETCPYHEVAQCLKENLWASQKEVEHLKHQKMKRHNEASLKWRTSALYYKRKCRDLEEWIEQKGLEVPKVEELNVQEVRDNSGQEMEQSG